jgi:hypothetical protein
MADARRDGVFMVGHNRAATRGTVNDQNAHPFWVDDKIVLVHNGTMRGDHKKIADVEVDTHAIAHAIAKNDNIEEVMQDINAAFALAWYNVEQKTLRLLRNSERPIHIARTQMGGLMFASELEFILFAAHRNKITLKEKPYMLAADNLCEYKLDGKGNWEFDEREVDVRYRYKGGSASSHSFSDCGYGDGYGDAYGSWVGRVTREVVNEINYETAAEAAHERWQKSKKAITRQFSEYLVSSRPETWLDDDEAEEAIKYSEQLQQQKTAVVEIEDFIPTNDHPQCDTWYVYGSPVDPNRDEAKAMPVLFWIKAGYTKDQMNVYAAHGFYRVNVQPRPSISFKDENNNSQRVVMAFGSDSVPCVTNSNESLVN